MSRRTFGQSISLEDFAEAVLDDELPLREEEWRPELDATEGLTDAEREAAAGALRRMGRPRLFTGVDLGRPGFSAASIRHMANAMSRASRAMVTQVFPAMHKFARAAATLQSFAGQIQGQRHDLVIMDDLTSYRPRAGADRLTVSERWWWCAIHPESLKRLVPDDPVFPPKVEGETVVPGIGRTCMDPRLRHVGRPIWPIWPFGQAAPLPLDQMPEVRTFEGQRSKARKPPLRCVPARPAHGRHRKQRR